MRRFASLALLVLGTFAVLGVTWWLLTSEPESGPGQGRPPYVLPVTLATVARGDVEPQVQLTGSVTSSQRARLGFEVAGRISELLVREGDTVARGDRLAVLDDSDQRASLLRAEAMAALAERELERALAGSRSEEIRRLAADLEVRKAEADLARKEVERGRELAATNVISQSQLDTLISQSSTAQARVASAQEQLAQAEAGTRKEELEIARAQLDLRRAEVEIARNELAKTVLVAPSDGSIVRRLAALGDSIGAGSPVIEMVDLSAREIELEIPSRYGGQVGADAPVAITLDEFPDFRLRTQVDALVAAADVQSRNFRGIVRLDRGDDPELVLKPGVFVRARMGLVPLRERLTLPADALRIVPSGTIVVRAVPAPADAAPAAGPPGGGPPGGGPPAPALAAEWVHVRLLGSAAGTSAVEVLEGELAAGDQVVVTGVDLAFPGVPLLPRPPTGEAAPAAAPPAGAAEAPDGDHAAAAPAEAPREGAR